MTIPVEIIHTMPGYDKCITVEEMSVDINGEPMHRNIPAYKTVLKPGEKVTKYVYGGQVLLVTEGPNVADLPAPVSAPDQP